MRFTSQLQHLNASVTSAQKAAQYALKYKDMDEDLHSCIVEQLERGVSPLLLREKNEKADLHTEQYEYQSQHHVLHRAFPGDGAERQPRGLRSHDATRHYSDRRCSRSG